MQIPGVIKVYNGRLDVHRWIKTKKMHFMDRLLQRVLNKTRAWIIDSRANKNTDEQNDHQTVAPSDLNTSARCM